MAVAKQPLLDAVMLLEQFRCLYQTASLTPGHLPVPNPPRFSLPENPTPILHFRYPGTPPTTQSRI